MKYEEPIIEVIECDGNTFTAEITDSGEEGTGTLNSQMLENF